MDYAGALGIWSHKLHCDECLDKKEEERKEDCSKCIKHELKPKKIDNLAFSRINGNKQREDDTAWKLEQVGELYTTIVLRQYPQISEQEKKDLDEFTGLRLNQIMTDMLIRFRWTTKEDMDKARAKLLGEEFEKKKII